MHTVVLQSFRTRDVPPWLAACLRSVQAWARQSGWAHRFLDDAFFGLAPAWARERCAGNLYALTDLCRLVWAERELAAGAERVVWADADLLVFDPARLQWPVGIGHGFARELFLPVDAAGGIGAPQHGINNALMVFERGDPVLADYRQACEATLAALPPGPPPRTALGPALLTRLGRERPLQAIEGVGLFTLAQMQAIAQPEPDEAARELLAQTLRHSLTAPAAANLCHFLRNATPPARRAGFDALYGQAVQRLLDSRGAVLRGA